MVCDRAVTFPGTDANRRIDCIQFQELLLGSKMVFIGGMAEAKSKGRGEECISQNLRILRAQNGKRTMLFFANSQRRELKRYVSIPRKSLLDFGSLLEGYISHTRHSQLRRQCEASEKARATGCRGA